MLHFLSNGPDLTVSKFCVINALNTQKCKTTRLPSELLASNPI